MQGINIFFVLATSHFSQYDLYTQNLVYLIAVLIYFAREGFKTAVLHDPLNGVRAYMIFLIAKLSQRRIMLNAGEMIDSSKSSNRFYQYTGLTLDIGF